MEYTCSSSCSNKTLIVLTIFITICLLGLHVYVIYNNPQSHVMKFISKCGIIQRERDSPVYYMSDKYKGYKIILLWTGYFGKDTWFWPKLGCKPFKEKACKEQRCLLTADLSNVKVSDAVLFHMLDLHDVNHLPEFRRPHQKWIFFNQESPRNTFHKQDISDYDYVFNTTITYRTDSDIIQPYGWKVSREQSKGHMKSKTKLIVWFVSNCKKNIFFSDGTESRRSYAKELGNFINIDIFGRCGKPDPCNWNHECTLNMVSTYKFYLAFENSQCTDYITEKFWRALKAGSVPVVLGAKMEEYEKIAPPNSYIHVDNFTSAQDLADYLKFLDKNDNSYKKYHKWRHLYDIRMTHPSEILCDICELLHTNKSKHTQYKSYKMSEFWNPVTTCR